MQQQGQALFGQQNQAGQVNGYLVDDVLVAHFREQAGAHHPRIVDEDVQCTPGARHGGRGPVQVFHLGHVAGQRPEVDAGKRGSQRRQWLRAAALNGNIPHAALHQLGYDGFANADAAPVMSTFLLVRLIMSC